MPLFDTTTTIKERAELAQVSDQRFFSGHRNRTPLLTIYRTMFGELINSATVGFSAGHRPYYLSETAIAYVVGNTINFHETVKVPGTSSDTNVALNGSGSGPQLVKGQQVTTKLPPAFRSAKPISAMSVLNLKAEAAGSKSASRASQPNQSAAAAVDPTNIIAYTERQSRAIKLLSYPSMEAHQVNIPESDNALDIVQLCFSHDGQFLAVVSDLPTYQLHIFELRTGTVLCSSAVNDEPIDQVSFNPWNAKQLCTSGREGTVDFWELEAGYHKFSLRHLPGSELRKLVWSSESQEHVDAPHLHWTVGEHCWTTSSRVLVTIDDNAVACYDPTNGVVRLISLPSEAAGRSITAVQKFITFGTDIIAIGMDGFMHRMQLSKNYAFVAEATYVNKALAGHSAAFVEASPSKRSLLVTTINGFMFEYVLVADEVHKIMETHTGAINCVVAFRDGKKFATGGADGTLCVWNSSTHSIMHRVPVGSAVTALACAPWSPLMVAGTANGQILAFEVGSENPRLIAHHFVHIGAVQQIAFDATGAFFASCSNENGVVLYSIAGGKIHPVGHLITEGTVTGITWKSVNGGQVGNVDQQSLLYVLSNTKQGSSTVSRFHVNTNAMDTTESLTTDDVNHDIFVSDETLHGIAVFEETTGKEVFFSFGVDRKLKEFSLSGNKPDSNEAFTRLDAPMRSHEDHGLYTGGIVLGGNCESLYTYSADGYLVVRSATEAEPVLKVLAHDPFYHGVLSFAAARDCRLMVTVGGDGIIRVWEWTYSPLGLKEANQTTADALAELDINAAHIREQRQQLARAQTIDPVAFDGAIPFTAPTELVHDTEEKERTRREVEEAEKQFQKQLQAVRSNLALLMERNAKAPAPEQLSPDDFLVDPEEKVKLEEVAQSKLNKVRASINKTNCTKRVLYERLKTEFWDSMAVAGRSIKSFLPDSLTNTLLEVSNYPLRKRAPEDLRVLEKIKLQRRIQLAKMKKDEEAAGTPAIPDSAAITLFGVDSELSQLLFSPFELSTKERRVMQAHLLRELVVQVKTEFNKTFQEKAKQKQDEIVKIEDKNERIREVLRELATNEQVYVPVIHDEEAPERAIEVKDSEVKAEKFISAEEQKRIDEKKRAEEERLRANVDDSRERALMTMMGGRLEDRTEEEAAEELAVPAFIDKPKSELTDEERKILKEYEAKQAAKMEEEEKRRKALETELRKLQLLVTDMCKAFDQSLAQFLLKRVEADQKICQMELQVIMLSQTALLSEDDDNKERAIYSKMERLQQEKAVCMREIPEIKDDLEIYRETYETAAKRDKDIERQFRKEIASYDFYVEALMKLFKNRELKATESDKVASDTFFDMGDDDTEEEADGFVKLVFRKDAPEGLPQDAWDKMVTFREKKIASEKEVQRSYQKFAELQGMVTAVLDNSERIRVETDEVVRAMNEFVEYKFHSTYNSRVLFYLTQGQIEVPQAPVVTDYSEAILIDQREVEKLNEVIVSHSKAKVDALTEMKDYRRGIHAAEWETKVLDYQAEDLVIRTRDIQLLRVSKDMQEFLRSGDKKRDTGEVSALERRSEHNQIVGEGREYVARSTGSSSLVKMNVSRSQLFQGRINERKNEIHKISAKVASLQTENSDLESQLRSLDAAIAERQKIIDVQAKLSNKTSTTASNGPNKMMARRKLADLTRAQARDIAVMRAELKKLRLKNYPALPPLPKSTLH